MAFGISRIFRATDSGAPQITSSNGSLINVLKAVLVNGYGVTAPLGWTIEFETTNKIVFRMKGGTKKYIQIDDTAVLTSGGGAYIAAFGSMTSVDNGVNRIPEIGALQHIYRHYTGWSTGMPWIIIGDDAGIWILSRALNTHASNIYNNLLTPYYIGDYTPYDIRNKWNFCIIAGVPIIPVGLTATGVNGGSKFYAERGSSFAYGPVFIGCIPFNYSISGKFGQNLSITPSFNAPKLNGVPIGTPIRIYEAFSTATNANTILGCLPGVLEPFGYFNGPITMALTVPIETIDQDGDMSMYTFGYSGGATADTMDRFIFKIGKGFRNVQ